MAVEPAATTEISLRKFYERIQSEHDLVLLDVRNADVFSAWRIESRHTPETINVPYFQFVEEDTLEAAIQQVPTDREVVVVCAHGGASDYVAEILRERGIRSVNLAGGMDAWGAYHVFRMVAQTPACSILQVERVARGCLSYVVISGRQAAVIDPSRYINEYLRFFEEHQLELTLILDTHAHADHISGGSALAEATGAPYYLHPYDAIHPFDMLPAQLAYEMLHDGRMLTLGDLTLQVIHTPGHTLGQVNFLASSPDGQHYLFTGDNLFLQSFGRPDLGGQGERWVHLVFETIFKTVRERVPESALILPGHYATPHEAQSGGIYAMPLNDLWQHNRALHIDGEAEFVDYVLNNLPKMPQEYIEIKRVNIGLLQPDEHKAFELELGKNICALSSAYEAADQAGGD